VRDAGDGAPGRGNLRVDRPGALAALNRRILEAYSRRVIGALRASLPFGGAVAHLEPMLARNVAKEIRKDALVIRRASALPATGPDAAVLRDLLETTRQIDREFLAQAGGLPIRIVIPYGEVAPIRLRRIERLFRGAGRILDAWQREGGLRAGLRASHPRAEFEQSLHELLRLYAMETRVLSRSVQLPLLLVPIRERIALSLYETMNDVARCLAAEVTALVFKA
jgi:hypothetical protein